MRSITLLGVLTSPKMGKWPLAIGHRVAPAEKPWGPIRHDGCLRVLARTGRVDCRHPCASFPPFSVSIAMLILKIKWLCIQECWNPEVVIILGTAACYRRATVGSSHDYVHPDNPRLHTILALWRSSASLTAAQYSRLPLRSASPAEGLLPRARNYQCLTLLILCALHSPPYGSWGLPLPKPRFPLRSASPAGGLLQRARAVPMFGAANCLCNMRLMFWEVNARVSQNRGVDQRLLNLNRSTRCRLG
jgi:hypothetical protein